MIHTTDPLNNLLDRYSEDVRHAFILPQYKEEDPRTFVYFPITNVSDDGGRVMAGVALTRVGEQWAPFEYVEKISDKDSVIHTLTVEEKLVNGEYPVNFVKYKVEDVWARIMPRMEDRNSYPKYFCTKFSFQNGDPMLNSPVMIRWAEVILNRAEAYAKLGNTDKALADVNVIRTRAGLSGNALFAPDRMHGYTNLLDVVLDERRLELSYEGFRTHDLTRNKRDMDRRFAGAQTWEVVRWDDPRWIYPIPFNETAVSGIE